MSRTRSDGELPPPPKQDRLFLAEACCFSSAGAVLECNAPDGDTIFQHQDPNVSIARDMLRQQLISAEEFAEIVRSDSVYHSEQQVYRLRGRSPPLKGAALSRATDRAGTASTATAQCPSTTIPAAWTSSGSQPNNGSGSIGVSAAALQLRRSVHAVVGGARSDSSPSVFSLSSSSPGSPPSGGRNTGADAKPPWSPPPRDPISLEPLGPAPYVFARGAHVRVRYNAATLSEYLISTGDFVEPTTRLKLTLADVLEIERCTANDTARGSDTATTSDQPPLLITLPPPPPLSSASTWSRVVVQFISAADGIELSSGSESPRGAKNLTTLGGLPPARSLLAAYEAAGRAGNGIVGSVSGAAGDDGNRYSHSRERRAMFEGLERCAGDVVTQACSLANCCAALYFAVVSAASHTNASRRPPPTPLKRCCT